MTLSVDEIAAERAAVEEWYCRRERKLLAEVLRWARTSGWVRSREHGHEGGFVGHSWKRELREPENYAAARNRAELRAWLEAQLPELAGVA